MNMNNSLTQFFSLNNADRFGALASFFCAIHCGLAPVFLILMPSFGKVWAHPASHALAALVIVPLAGYSIYKGYSIHQKRWVLVTAAVGIFFVLCGAILPAFSTGSTDDQHQLGLGASELVVENSPVADCDTRASYEMEADCSNVASTLVAGGVACVDACCPSVEFSDTGEVSLHIPPAAIITTLGGIFLISAHIGNLCQCGHACRVKMCCRA